MTVPHRLSLKLVSVCIAASAAFTPAAHAADPVTINIVDVAGDLQLTQKGFEAFKAKYPNLVANMTFTNAPAPQLPGKIKAMQAAGRSDIDLVLTGTDALAAGIEQNLWIKLLPDNAAQFPGRRSQYSVRGRIRAHREGGRFFALLACPRPQLCPAAGGAGCRRARDPCCVQSLPFEHR